MRVYRLNRVHVLRGWQYWESVNGQLNRELGFKVIICELHNETINGRSRETVAKGLCSSSGNELRCFSEVPGKRS